jgi:hypothetical protein
MLNKKIDNMKFLKKFNEEFEYRSDVIAQEYRDKKSKLKVGDDIIFSWKKWNYKELKEFQKSSGCKDGYSSTCKKCLYNNSKETKKEWYKNNSEKLKQNRKLNVEERKKWKQNNPDKIKLYSKKSYQTRKKKLLEKGEEYLKEHWRKQSQKHRDRNPEKYRKYIREYHIKWRKKHPNYYIQPHNLNLNPGELNYFKQYILKNKDYIKKLISE